ncbi:MAG TPA: hypothetical protein VFM95_08915, partial [Microcella sp.]|nr:hypothetical protein [Microcella sp.]
MGRTVPAWRAPGIRNRGRRRTPSRPTRLGRSVRSRNSRQNGRVDSGEGDEQTARPPFRICFVCTGNICRSPMAEAVMKRIIRDRGWEGQV